ncbi:MULTISPECIES: hypothetical protein [Aeromonas]|uniref:hypothetical protein n=1 Tax=Aeromonas TaxID=642 RepID=UPI000DD5B823|nr:MULTISPECIES: hypothetical protein [Aeromonas]AXA99973.1 hypothetical protein C1C92_02440 [Aeromonas caviae]QLL81906.1 hypothetical protein GWC92_17270 [Aeromonas caviae]QXB99432.1 hypothetical protein I6L48_00295 [Aeromonas sp. FDAARGOS 1418]UBS64771.1 hypothetical protein LCG53_18005 [Aeromonas caviae]WKS84227.1 hypothetical protein NHU86_16950 [Aeromonas caviae]
MSLDVAYSIEVDDYVDPDKAYDLYWAGLIADKQAFLCPGTDCTAQVTCCNIDKDTQNMRVIPHFRIYGKNHAKTCEVARGIDYTINYTLLKSKDKEKASIDSSIVDEFIINRPSSYYDERLPGSPEAKNAKKQLMYKGGSLEERLREIGHSSKIYSVRSVVSRRIRYEKDGSLHSRRVNVLGKDVAYKSIMKCIWEQDLEKLPEYPVIYYGWAYIDRLSSNQGYRIKFKKKLKFGQKMLDATIIIFDSLIDSYKIKKLVSTRLTKIVSGSKQAFVFVYGKPEINQSKQTDKVYANFKITNLDMIDVNHESPFPKPGE